MAANSPAVIQDLVATSGEPIPLKIEPPDDAAEYRFVMVQGLPEDFKLTTGLRSGKNWAVARSDTPELKVTTPAGFTGELKLQILFFAQSGQPPRSSTLVNIRVRPAPSPQQDVVATIGARPKGPAEEAPAPPPPSLTPKVSPAEETELLLSAESYRQNGDIVTARLLYEQLARMGSAKGALAMGQSYDPAFLNRSVLTSGMRPDPVQAKRWYETAEKLGSPDAQQRLKVLGQVN